MNDAWKAWCGIAATLLTLTGCVSATESIKKKDVNLAKYSEVMLGISPDDPRNVTPRAIKEFEALGLKVTTFPADKPFEGPQGTGFLVTEEGHVLTCAHVIGDEATATVWIAGVRHGAKVLGKDVDKDIALLLVDLPKGNVPVPLSLRDDKRYALGADISTIGYPLSSVLGNSARFTRGSISAAAGLKDNPDHIQISAEIQPGNSGGPVLDKSGTVVGMVQQTLNALAMAQQTGGALPQNVNFAVKADVLLDYLKANQQAVFEKLSFNKTMEVEDAQRSVVKVRSGIVHEEPAPRAKLIAYVEYESLWDIWHRFKYFIVYLYDFESRDLVMAAGQGRDNLISTEDVVIRDTFAEVRKARSGK